MSLISTVPGAITTFQGYMTTVAAASAVPDVQVYLGKQATEAQLAYNFFMVGDYAAGVPVAPDSYDWASMSVTAQRVNETYSLLGCIGCWAGGYDSTNVLTQLTNAYSLLNGLHQAIRNDPGGSGNLSPSGAWSKLEARMEIFGAVQTGWGVIFGLELSVVNAQLTP